MDGVPDGEGTLDRLNRRLGATLERYATPQNIESMRESCIFNIITHGGMGFVFGGALGLFLSGMASTGPEAALLGGTAPAAVGVKVQAKQIFREMGSRTWSSAKSFAKIAALYSGFECAVESYRAKHDLVNTVAAGCLTGAVLGAKAGPKSALLGCAGFAAFSTAIEHFMQESHGDD